MPIFFVTLAFTAVMVWHAVKTGRQQTWLFILILAPGLGGLVYFLCCVIPDLMGGPQARRLGAAAKEKLDPTRAYREAKAACDDSPTTGARMRLAAAAFDLERYEEAEDLYRQAAQGVHEEDPALLFGRAQALVELRRYQDALAMLVKLGETGEKGRTSQAALAMGRAYEGLGQYDEADTAYEWASARFPGLEASARYVAFLVLAGRRAEAETLMAEIEKRAARAQEHFRKEARHWRDFAAGALART
ncbi:MAG: hypothetical protein ABIO39_12025 [Caulobacteraceae bacterium]